MLKVKATTTLICCTVYMHTIFRGIFQHVKISQSVTANCGAIHVWGSPRWYTARDAVGWQITTLHAHGSAQVCGWQTYCSSVEMQAATQSTVNSMYPSSPVYHSSLLTIARGPTGIGTHPLVRVVLVANIVQWWMVEVFELRRCAVTVTIIQTLEDWRVIELWPVMEFLQLCVCKLKFAFAYCKWLMYLQHVSPVSAAVPLLNMFSML